MKLSISAHGYAWLRVCRIFPGSFDKISFPRLSPHDFTSHECDSVGAHRSDLYRDPAVTGNTALHLRHRYKYTWSALRPVREPPTNIASRLPQAGQTVSAGVISFIAIFFSTPIQWLHRSEINLMSTDSFTSLMQRRHPLPGIMNDETLQGCPGCSSVLTGRSDIPRLHGMPVLRLRLPGQDSGAGEGPGFVPPVIFQPIRYLS
jgi:hypothetical protein